MKMQNRELKVRALTLAVTGVFAAICAMPGHADDGLAAVLKTPTNFVEFGALSTSRDSAKFGEYTGLNKSGGYLIGNFGIRGGDAYGDGNGTMRWSVTGTDLGLTSRALGATVSNQGRWNLGISYDELRHFTSDTYQTPYQGSMGGNSFTLPAGFAAAALNAGAGTRALSATQLAAFQPMGINNTRENTSLTGGIILNDRWELKVDFNHLDQSGAKLVNSFGAYAFSGAAGEKISILPMPTNSKTDMITAAVNWTGDKGHATGSYFGSFYRDNISGVTFQTWGQAAPTTQTMGTFPSNTLHQLNLTGGYAFSTRTRVAGGLSYGRNTQNTPYNYDSGLASGATGGGVGPMTAASPTSSLNGSIRNTHADLKVTDQTTRNLMLSAGFKYDDRDNRTASNIYSARGIDGNPNNRYSYPNTPLSIKRTQLELAGDYRIDQNQKIRMAFNHEQIDRKCNQYATGGGVINAGSFPYAAGTNCVTATSTKDDRLSATYRRKAGDDINFNVGYTYSNRKTSFDENARAAFISTDGSIPGFTTPGINGGDYRGFHPYFEASRTQNLLKAGASWQATDRLSLGANGRYTNDDYKQTLGAQKGTQGSVNLDATFNYREEGTLSAYVTQQRRTRDVTDQQGFSATVNATTLSVPLGGTFTNKLKDGDTTVGFSVKQGGLMGGKLDLLGDWSYSMGKTHYETALNYPPTTALTCADPVLLTCGSTPEIKSRMTQFRFSGNYKLDKSAKVSVGYIYRRLSAEDFYYNGLQNLNTPTNVLPTNQQAPNYSVNAIWASYMYTFQ